METVFDHIDAKTKNYPICYFCDEPITVLEGTRAESLIKHHLNGNRYDNRSYNLVSAHAGCHMSFHAHTNTIQQELNKEDAIKKVFGNKILCFFCGEPINNFYGKKPKSILLHHVSYEPEIIKPVHYGCHSSENFKGEKNPNYGKDMSGKNNPAYGTKRSPEELIKLSHSHKGQIPWNTGKTRSEQTKEKIRISRARQPPPMLGKKHTLESRKKMSLAHTGYKTTSETIEKLRLSGKRTAQQGWATRRERDPTNEWSKKLWETRRKRYGPTGMKPR